MRRGRLAVFALVAALAAGMAVWMLRPVAAPLTERATTPMAEPVVRFVEVGGPGLHGVIGQERFWQEARTSAPSANRIDFRFAAPVEVVGVLVSLDDRGMEMAEFAVGVNAPTYGLEGDWLIHTSTQPADEQAWFDPPFLVEPTDSVSVVAWLYNAHDAPYWVSPEVIVYYRWR